MKVSLQDIFAGIAALMLIGLIGYLSAVSQPVDDSLKMGLAAALAYLFGRDPIQVGGKEEQ